MDIVQDDSTTLGVWFWKMGGEQVVPARTSISHKKYKDFVNICGGGGGGVNTINIRQLKTAVQIKYTTPD